MSFTWPWMLLSLGALPVLVLIYRRLLRRRAARRSALASLGLIAPGAVSSGWRRHVAPALFLIALTLLLIALARPQANLTQAHREGTVILAFDVSASMSATDVRPSRLAAAKSAARAFVERQPATVRIGVVAFGGSGLVTQVPTADRARTLRAIDRLTPQGGTSLARGLQTSLSAIAGKTVHLDPPSSSVEPKSQNLGYHGSAAVILLSDGENTSGPDPMEVAQLASSAGVRVYPIGLGSPEGTVLKINGYQVATSLNASMLRDIASVTDGRYFAAVDDKALSRVYSSIDLAWRVEAEHVELTALFAAAAALLLLLGVGGSMVWFGRVM